MSEFSILAAFAHPDDETILAGGLIGMFSARGGKVHILLATRGEGGELGEPPITERSRLGFVRELELRCAAEALGAHSVTFLNYIDPEVGKDEALYPFEADLESLSQEIAAAMRATRAQALLTHGSNGEYGHPAHILMHQASKFALQSAWGTGIPLYTIAADFPDHPRPRLANQGDPAHFIVDVSPWLATKLKAAECHRTQHALFVRRSSQEAGRALALSEVLMPVESLHRAWPPAGEYGDDPVARFLREHCHEALISDDLKHLPEHP